MLSGETAAGKYPVQALSAMVNTVNEAEKHIDYRKRFSDEDFVIGQDITNAISRACCMQQFVIEAATTSALGGIVGILLGFLLSAIASVIIPIILGENIAVIPSFTSIAVAFGISTAIGVVFGYLPAKKAAVLNPIDALRNE